MSLAFIAPAQGAQQLAAPVAGIAAARPAAPAPAAQGWSAAAAMGAAVGVIGAAATVKSRKQQKAQAGVSSQETKVPVGKGGLVVGASGEFLTVISACPKTGALRPSTSARALPWLRARM